MLLHHIEEPTGDSNACSATSQVAAVAVSPSCPVKQTHVAAIPSAAPSLGGLSSLGDLSPPAVLSP